MSTETTTTMATNGAAKPAPNGKHPAILESGVPFPAALPAAAQPFRFLPLARIRESDTNPRRNFDAAKLKALAENIKTHGVLVPLLVRTYWRKLGEEESFEIVAGARRYRAAKLSGIAEVPVRVVELTDQEALEVQVIENLQREDVHPLEEAEGFRRLLDIEGYTAETLSAKVNRDESYIYKRLQLAKLIEPLKGKFLEGEITIGHALLLCRLGEQDQIETAKSGLYRSTWGGNRHENVLITAKSLDHWIRENIYLDLKQAPWNKLDAELVPKAGACNACPKRSGSNAHLFDDMGKSDVCLDAACFQAKREAHLVQIEKKSAAAGTKLIRVATEYLDGGREKALRAISSGGYERVGKKKCTHAEKALVVTGREDVGRIIDICRESKCKTHHPYGARLSSRVSGTSAFAQVWAEKKRHLKARIERQVRLRTLEQILAKPLKWDAPHAQLQVVAKALLPYSTPGEVLTALNVPAAKGRKFKNGSEVSRFLEGMIDAPKGSPASDMLPQILLALSLQGAAKEYAPGSDIKRLTMAAEATRVDVKKIEGAVSKQLTADFEKSKAKAAEKRKKEDAAEKAAGKKGAGKAAKAEPEYQADEDDELDDGDDE